MRTVLLAAIGVALISLPDVSFAQEYPHAFPRPGVVKIMENERVLVWEATWPADVTQVYHQHQYDMTGVFLRWGPLRVTRLDGTFTESLEPFEIPWVFFLEKGVTHIEEGIGDPVRHSIMIDLKEGSPPRLEGRTDFPSSFPQEGAEEVLDNDRVRVWSLEPRPGQTIPMHFHDRDFISVVLEGGTLALKGADGREERTTWAYKDVRFVPRGEVHSIEVVSGTPRIMIFELK